jgi:hypothetical protein
MLLVDSVELRRTFYDPAAAATRLANSSWSRAAWWAETFVLQQASDIEALEVVAGVVGRLPAAPGPLRAAR